MTEEEVIVFKEYPLAVGQRIHLDGGFRRGDWLVIGMTDKKIHLRCPVSGREVEWERIFCFAGVSGPAEWPGAL